jgi:hypothetical protein
MNPGQVMWNLWWIKWHWSGFPPSTLVFPANSSANSSPFINHLITYSYIASVLTASLKTNQPTKKKTIKKLLILPTVFCVTSGINSNYIPELLLTI